MALVLNLYIYTFMDSFILLVQLPILDYLAPALSQAHIVLLYLPRLQMSPQNLIYAYFGCVSQKLKSTF